MSTTSQQQQPQHGRRRVFKQPRQPPSLRSEQRPPSRRTTSRRSPDNSNEHHNNVRNEEIDYDVIEPRPRFDRCLISSELHRRLQQNGPLSSIFRFLLVVLSIFLSKPSRHHKLLRHGFEPQLSNIFLSISCTRTFHLIWFDLSRGRQIEVTNFFFQQLKET